MTDRLFLGNTTGIPQQTIQRPNDAAPYAAGDVIGTVTVLPGTNILDFADVAAGPGAAGMISGAVLIDSANQAALPSLELWLFTVAPADQVDNAAFAPSDAEIANLVGVVTLANVKIGNPGAGAAGNLIISSDVTALSFKCGGGTTHLYGVLVVRNAYTPVNNEQFTVKLFSLKDIAQAA